MDTGELMRTAAEISDTEKIINLSDAELGALKFLGPVDAVHQVINFIEVIKKVPQEFEWLTVFQLQCLSAHLKFHPTDPAWPATPTFRPDISGTTAVDPDLVSLFERVHFYTGISEDHPLLLHRSDILQRPFVIPRERFSVIPEKTAHSANHPILKNKLWKETVAPEIVQLLKVPSRGVYVSTMLPVRFSTADENGKAVVDDHIVLWISVYPNTTKETACRDANADILAILAKHGVQDVAVHWIEGAVESLGGPPPMMHLVWDTDPTHYIRRALTAVLGVPLAAEANSDAQGSLGLYFHEGNKSNRLMCLTNKHVVSSNTNKDYDYSDRLAQRFIRNCSSLRFQQVLNETRAFIATKLENTMLFAEQLAEMKAEGGKNKERKHHDLKRAQEDVVELADFFQLLTSNWSDAYQRIIGYLDWAPKIAHDIDSRRYTRDIAVIALDDNKFKQNFQGNSVYLAGKYALDEINSFFSSNRPSSFKYPTDHLFKLSGHVDAAGHTSPYLSDENGNPGFIVVKHGQSTDLTFGRLSELEAYTCNESGHLSWESAVLNFSKKHGNFSGKGDSGAAIFNVEGKLVAILHSGMSMSSHVAFGTPGHFVLELVKKRYPFADFDCLESNA